jgi:hypothetical protein
VGRFADVERQSLPHEEQPVALEVAERHGASGDEHAKPATEDA